MEVRGAPILAVLFGAPMDPLMLTPPAGLMVYVATQPVDFRKGAEGLALLAKETLGHDPMKGVAAVFRARPAERVKIAVRDGSGLVMYRKRLDRGGFKWPSVVVGVMRMNAAQLSALLAGMDWTRMHASQILQPKVLASKIKSSLHRCAKHGRLGSMSDLPDEMPSDPIELRAFAAALLDRCARPERLLKLAKDARLGRSSENLTVFGYSWF